MSKFVSWFKSCENSERDAYIWNIVASTLNSVQAVVLLLVVTRGSNGVGDSAIFVISYAIANLLMTVGKYGMRNFQVTDVREQFSLETYVMSRRVSVAVMILGCVIYVIPAFVGGEYSLYKAIVIFSVTALRVFDSYEDVYHAELQKQGKLHIASKIVAIRLILYYGFFVILFIITDNLVIASLVSVLLSCGVGVLLNKMAMEVIDVKAMKTSRVEVLSLLKICFPVFACSFLLTYFSNAPKYIVDIYLTETEQAMFNYIFMPVFVICLLGNYVFLPMLAKVAVIWDNGEKKKFYMSLVRQTLVLLMITVVIFIGGYLVGLPFLELFFNAQLDGYKTEFLILLISGGLLAIVYLLNMFMTIVRRQKIMLICFMIASIVTLFVESLCAKYYGVLEISLSYAIILLMLSIVMFLMLTIVIMRDERKR